jgi:hypothetical protein
MKNNGMCRSKPSECHDNRFSLPFHFNQIKSFNVFRFRFRFTCIFISQGADGFARLEAKVYAVQPAGETKTAPELTQLKSDVAQFKADFSPRPFLPIRQFNVPAIGRC